MTTSESNEEERIGRFQNAAEGIKSTLAARYKTSFKGVGEAVRHAKKNGHGVVVQNSLALDVLVDLRNSIAHSRYLSGQPIAVPHERAVAAIEQLQVLIANVPRVHSVMVKNPTMIAPDDPLPEVLEIVLTKNLSQLPVRDVAGYHGLLTTNGIARWLAEALARNNGMLLEEDIRVRDAMSSAESSEYACFCRPTDDALDICRRLSAPDGPVAYLVTSDGTERAEIQGILTRADVVDITRDHSVPLL